MAAARDRCSDAPLRQRDAGRHLRGPRRARAWARRCATAACARTWRSPSRESALPRWARARSSSAHTQSATVIDCGGGVLTPGLVDSHTHAIFGKPRYEEQERRAAGADYMEIARQGGGIHSSVRDLRARGADELLALARPRLARLASYGTTTVEVKSGYGLSIEDELKILRVIRRLAGRAADANRPDLARRARDPAGGIAQLRRRAPVMSRCSVDEMLPLVASEHLAVFADVFCEPGVFTIDETRDLLAAARAAGLKLKLHADELAPSGGAELARRAARHLGGSSRRNLRRRHSRARRVGHRRDAAPWDDALPRERARALRHARSSTPAQPSRSRRISIPERPRRPTCRSSSRSA